MKLTTDTVKFTCPDCGRKLCPAPLMRHATLVLRRTCPGRQCRQAWLVKITPRVIRQGVASFADFTRLEGEAR